MDDVIYDGYETDSGQMEVRDGVATMEGMQLAIDGKFALCWYHGPYWHQLWTG